MEEAFNEIAHPFGGVAFVEPLRRRSAFPSRQMVAYGEGDAEATLEDGELPAAADDGEQLSCTAASGTSVEVAAATPLDSGAASSSSNPGGGDPNPAAGKGGKRKRLPNLVKSVRLPNWMDLDQESLPNGGQPVALVDTRRQQGDARPMPLPRKLDDFGGVGETTVQLRTARAPDASFDELLSGFAAQKEEASLRKRTPPSSYVCHRCSTPGHWIEDCPKAAESAATGEPPPGYVCHHCSVAGHWVSACPKKAARGKQQRPAKVRAADGAEPPPHESAMEEGEVQEAASDGTAGEGAAGASSEGGPAKRAKPANAKAASEKKGFSPVPPPGYVCNACHSTGHWLEQCPRRDEYRKGAPPTGYVCVKCNQAGHWVHNCTAAPKGGWKEHSAADGRSQAVESLVVGPAAREVGDEIAEALEEEAPEVVSLMHRCVEALGEAACRQLLVQTWQVEASGGLLTTDGSNRRRTPGGVFFWLVKQKASAEDRARIFSRPAESAISKPPSGE